jgi:signal transduction histidine kinase
MVDTGLADLATDPTSDQVSRWERGFDNVVAWGPYVALAFAAILSVIDPDDAGLPAATLVLAALAAAWVYVMFTDARRRGRDGQAWTRVYFAGLLVLGFLLMTHHPLFFVFVITGFLHAYLLRPAPVAFAGVALTSMVINSQIVLPEPNSDELWLFGIIVVVQTVAIGFGIIGGEKIAELSEQRRRALVELREAQEENIDLQARLVAQAHEAGVADERHRMAREIHDTVAQGLIGVVTQLEAAGQVHDDPIEVQRRIDNAARLARESLTEARRSVRALLPEPLEGRRLVEALDQLVSDWSALHGVTAEMATTGTPHALHPEVEVTLLRVVQEALANVAKHAAAGRVGVTLSYMGDVVTVDVRDDGIGFGDGDPTGGFGTTAMRQRVEALSGELQFESARGAGTAVSATLPALAPVEMPVEVTGD